MSLPKARECDLCSKHPAEPTYSKFGAYQYVCVYLCKDCRQKLQGAEKIVSLFIQLTKEMQ